MNIQSSTPKTMLRYVEINYVGIELWRKPENVPQKLSKQVFFNLFFKLCCNELLHN